MAVLEFGRFKVVPHRRELLLDGQPIALGDHAFDTLLALIDAGGTVVDKDELMRRVWPDRIVDENNLQGQISALRKALGADRDLIRTVAGRGYQFTGQIGAAAGASPSATSNLPQPVSNLIGRDVCMGEVVDLFTDQRLVTLTGAGGVGKTRLALEVARAVLARFPDGVWLAELGPLTDPELVPVTVAAALGLSFGSAAVTAERVAIATGGRRLLLLLDNCEHVIDAAARMAAALLTAGPGPRVLATSREPLRTGGEYVYRVPSLEVPAADDDDADDVLRHGAVRLFGIRAAEFDATFALDRHHASAVGAICRHLDGIPLAIELAAARVAALGIDGVAARLGDRFRLLTGGKRTALPRQQTLLATLDWSYDLLSDNDRVVMRRLAVFAGSFSLEAASAVVAAADLLASEVAECLADLVARSLVVTHAGAVRYRLLETTRAYARARLEEAGELPVLLRRHATYVRETMARAEVEWQTRPTADWLEAYAHMLADVRVALDWAFAPEGDTTLGCALTIVAVPLWLELSLLNESLVRLERARASHEAGGHLDARLELKLYASLAMSLVSTRGPRPEIDAMFVKVLEMAERLDDDEYRLRALWGLYGCRNQTGSGRIGLTLAQSFADIASTRPNAADRAIAERLIGTSLHFIGDQDAARRHLEQMLERQPRSGTYRSQTIRFLYDQRVLALATLTQVVWLQGLPERAALHARQAIAEAEATAHHPSLCFALAEAAAAIARYTGDLDALETSASRLLDVATRHANAGWQSVGRCLQALVLIKRGDGDAYTRLLQPAFDALGHARFFLHYTGFLAAVADGLADAGRVAEAEAVIADAFARCEVTEERWSMPELVRVRGELLLRLGAERQAEDHFDKALDLARRQQVLSWELRSALSLARLRLLQGRRVHARNVLAPVHRRFTEGFETADLVAAAALLKGLA